MTLTWGNSSNSAITPNMVAGDYWTLNITGAAPGAVIELQYRLYPDPPQRFTFAQTDSNGNYSASQQTTSASVGNWQDQWYVGGQPAGPPYNFQLIYKPGRLEVTYEAAISNYCPPSVLPTNYTYGIGITINYLVEDANGNAVSSNNIVLYPYFSPNGQQSGPVASAQSGANSLGQFNYSPLWDCGTGPFGPSQWLTETLYIKIGDSNVYDTVRQQVWYGWGFATPHSGEIRNDVNGMTDVDVTQ
ncbi:MAG TPA: hypothetical protein VGR73_10805 [Bryobacteraceae bacterium]|nr:hypothetical protein [Bryobacteraceae bacterium]